MSELELPVVAMRRPNWGDPNTPGSLPAAIATALRQLGARPRPAVEPNDVTLPEPTLAATALAAMTAVVGAAHVSTEPSARLAHTRGFSTPDLLKLRAGDAADAPDAVLTPGSHHDVVELLRVCAHHRIAVVPFSGGTSVVGGLAPARAGFAGAVTLDIARLDQLGPIDEVSRTAVLPAGLRGPRAEELLRARGFTLGHFPQSYQAASIGGYAAARSAGQSSAGYGRFDDMVVGLVLATPRGTIELGTAPKSAAGPDLRQLVLGSEGALGVITSVTVRIRPTPQLRLFEGWRFDTFDTGAAALRTLAQDGPLPTVLRLSDEVETALLGGGKPGLGGESPGGCLAITGYEGEPAEVTARQAAATAALVDAGGTPLGPKPGETWRAGRFHGPYLRDPLLDAGALAETLETATFWSKLGALRTAVTAALTETLTAHGTPPVVLCHLSHVYETGACLYFTVVCAQADDPLAQWAAAKSAANAAIRAAGATITHHHGVGADHRQTYHDEIGPLALETLRAVKKTLDPQGILNPGVLL